MIYVISPDGVCRERNTAAPAPPLSVFTARYGEGVVLLPHESDPYPTVPVEHLVLVDGQLSVDPAWSPPEAAAPVDLAARIADLEAVVAGNVLASVHDRRWLAQKERAKLFGIPWIQSHPEAGLADLEAAVLAELAEVFPGDPIVTGAGIVMSYAAEAAKRGYIPEPSFEALRDLVVGASAAQIQAMLAVL